MTFFIKLNVQIELPVWTIIVFSSWSSYTINLVTNKIGFNVWLLLVRVMNNYSILKMKKGNSENFIVKIYLF